MSLYNHYKSNICIYVYIDIDSATAGPFFFFIKSFILLWPAAGNENIHQAILFSDLKKLKNDSYYNINNRYTNWIVQHIVLPIPI